MPETRKERFSTWELNEDSTLEKINEIYIADFMEHTIKPLSKAAYLEVSALNKRDSSTFEIYRLFEVSDELLEKERIEDEERCRRWREQREEERRKKESESAE